MRLMTLVKVGRDRKLSFHFQGDSAERCRRLIDTARIRRAVRPLLRRQTLVIVHLNRRCSGVTGSWYGRSRVFQYFNMHYYGFDGDVITLVINPRWLRQKRVVHGPYYLAGSRSFRGYPSQRPMDAVIYVLAHEFAHHYLYGRRHPLRSSERATDLFAVQHLFRVEPRHPIARRVRLTNGELGLLLELMHRMPPERPARRKAAPRRVA